MFSIDPSFGQVLRLRRSYLYSFESVETRIRDRYSDEVLWLREREERKAEKARRIEDQSTKIWQLKRT